MSARRKRIALATWLGASAVMQLACVANPGVTSVAGTAGAPGDVYFLGVDHSPAGADGARIARLFGAAGDDRWSLTDQVRGIALKVDGGIGLDAPIDRWDPGTDPYNFGVILLRGASHRTMTWEGLASRTHASIDVTWLQIGHDSRTRMQQDKLPELRFTVNRYDVLELGSGRPPTAAQLDDLYRRTFELAIRELLVQARQRQERDLRRTAASIRYVHVKTPIVLPAAQRALAAFVPGGDSFAFKRLGDAMGAYLEQRLLERFAADPALDDYVLLPGERAVDYLAAEWGAFAQRVAALSTYNAVREALGQRPPRLLRAVSFCTPEGENEVHAIELRSNLVELQFAVRAKSDYVDQVRLTTFLAGDTKLSLDARRDDSPLGRQEPPAQVNYTSDEVEKPSRFSAGEFFGPHGAQMAVEATVDELVAKLTGKLRRLLDTQPLSHPSYQQRFCS